MDIERLAAQNPWWADKKAIEKDSKVRKVLETGSKIEFDIDGENRVLIGPRQLGSTTAFKFDIYKKIMKDHTDPSSILYFSFDTARNYEEISDVINTFVKDKGKKTLYLDEVSFVEGWQRAIKSFLDSDASTSATIHVTGSSSINLKKELMPGRKIKFTEFLPLSFGEFLLSFGSETLKQSVKRHSAASLDEATKNCSKMVTHFDEITKWFNIYIKTGGYPDAIFEYLNKNEVSMELYDVHWNAFISDISKSNKSIEIATAVIYGIIESYSSKVNLSKIAQMQGVKSHVTVREYIESFEDLFVAKSVFPMAGKKYVFRKERKVYFCDSLLYNMFSKKMNIIDKGSEPKVVEGMLFNHLFRFANRGKEISEPKTAISFFSGNREIDFVLDGFGFELKWQEKVAPSDFPKTGLNVKVLLSKNTYDVKTDTKIIPLQLFLALM
jgi:predicted AAA+ superfamily ATPase